MRHGHPLHFEDDESDHGRRLDNLGLIQARKGGVFSAPFFSGNVKILASSSKRTVETAEAAFPDLIPQMKVMDELYLAPLNRLIRIIGDIEDKIDTLAVIGHNPSITRAVNLLSDGKLDSMPAGGVAIIKTTGADWHEVSSTVGKLADVWIPRV